MGGRGASSGRSKPVQIMNRIKEGKLQNTKLERFTVLLKKGKSMLSLK